MSNYWHPHSARLRWRGSHLAKMSLSRSRPHSTMLMLWRRRVCLLLLRNDRIWSSFQNGSYLGQETFDFWNLSRDSFLLRWNYVEQFITPSQRQYFIQLSKGRYLKQEPFNARNLHKSSFVLYWNHTEKNLDSFRYRTREKAYRVSVEGDQSWLAEPFPNT